MVDDALSVIGGQGSRHNMSHIAAALQERSYCLALPLSAEQARNCLDDKRSNVFDA